MTDKTAREIAPGLFPAETDTDRVIDARRNPTPITDALDYRTGILGADICVILDSHRKLERDCADLIAALESIAYGVLNVVDARANARAALAKIRA